MIPGLTTFADRDSLMAAAAERLAEALRAGIEERGEACAALSGGGTPGPAYERLAEMPLDWRRVTFALVDERFVPPGDPASNEGLLRRTLAPTLAQGARVAPMFGAGGVEDAAQRADAAYANLTIDIALLGMGGDGHTASWFPGAEHEAMTSPCSVIAVTAPGARGAVERLTLTRTAVARAKRAILLITGAEKRARLEQALANNDAPVAALFDGANASPDVLYTD